MTSSKRLRIPKLLLSLALVAPAAWAQDGAPANSEMGSALMYELLIGEISLQNGDPGSAFQLMLDAAQKSRSDQVFSRAVDIALRARAGDSALQAAQAWTRALPASKEGMRYLLQILIGLNKLPETVEPIKRDLASMPQKERAVAINQVPRYFVRATDKKLAAKVVEQALAAETANAINGPAAWAAIGTMRLLAGDGEAALEAAKKGAILNPKAEEPGQLALALIDPKLPGAEVLVLKHLEVTSGPEVRMGYVRRLLDAQRLKDATAQVLVLNEKHPDFADAWLVRGSLALQEQKPDEAQSALTRFVQLRQQTAGNSDEAAADRGLTQAYFLLADIAEKGKKPEEAQRYLDLIDSPQDNLRVQIRRAGILARQGKLDEGRQLIRTAPEIQAEDARAKVSAEVQLLRDNRRFQDAYDLLKQTVQDNPGDADYLYDLAMAAEKLDKMVEMEKLLRQVIAAKPDYHHAYNALGYSLADRKMRLPEARELIKKALEFAPDDPFILDSLGWVEFRSGNTAQALEILQGAYQRRPDPEIAAHLGEVLWSLRQQQEARAIWKDGLSHNPDNDTLNETMKRLGLP